MHIKHLKQCLAQASTRFFIITIIIIINIIIIIAKFPYIFSLALSESSSKNIVPQIFDQWFGRREAHTNSSKMFKDTKEMHIESVGAMLRPLSH